MYDSMLVYTYVCTYVNKLLQFSKSNDKRINEHTNIKVYVGMCIYCICT